MRNSYRAFRGKPGSARHPVLAGFGDAPYTVNCIRAVDTEPAGALPDAPVTLIPSYPDLPMEYVYERAPRGDTPEIFLRDLGRERTVYFPMDIDRTFWEVLLEDHGRLLANAVRWAMNEEQRPDPGVDSGRRTARAHTAEARRAGCPGEAPGERQTRAVPCGARVGGADGALGFWTTK